MKKNIKLNKNTFYCIPCEIEGKKVKAINSALSITGDILLCEKHLDIWKTHLSYLKTM